MRIVFAAGAMLALATLVPAASLAQDTDIEALRAEIEALRADYDARIGELEQRLAVAEQDAAAAAYTPPPATAAAASIGNSGNKLFNPAIGVIFEGQAWSFNKDPDNYAIPGFPLGGEAGLAPEGLSLGETELDFSANVDDKFTAWLTLPVALDDGEAAVEIEEAWIEATALPAGFAARFGRFFSGIGYLNAKHSHTWDFADQPLPYQAFLANQYIDNGVQLRWLAPTDLYMEFGAELFQGDRYPGAGSAHSGLGAYSLYTNFGGDVGANSSWLAGASWLDTKAIDRASGDPDDPFIFNGDSRIAGAHFVWKWAPNGNWKQKNFVAQAEVFQRKESGMLARPGELAAPYDVTQEGWYAQAVFQPFPHWRFGARSDGLSTNGSDPRRYSLMMDWSNSEFSRVRLQYTRDQAGIRDDNQWGLQYFYSIGAHGAHTF